MPGPNGDEDGGGGRRKPASPVFWVRRVGWFVALWVGSILALGVVAYGIRSMIL